MSDATNRSEWSRSHTDPPWRGRPDARVPDAVGVWPIPETPVGELSLAQRYLRALHAEGLTVAQVVDLLPGYPDPAGVHRRLAEGSLRGVLLGEHLRLLACQFTLDGQVPWIGLVVIKFPAGIDPLTIDRFITEQHDSLRIGRERVSPREWLIHDLGQPALVIDLAAAVAVKGLGA